MGWLQRLVTLVGLLQGQTVEWGDKIGYNGGLATEAGYTGGLATLVGWLQRQTVEWGD